MFMSPSGESSLGERYKEGRKVGERGKGSIYKGSFAFPRANINMIHHLATLKMTFLQITFILFFDNYT